MILSVTHEDVYLLSASIGEALEAVRDSEFQTRLGFERADKLGRLGKSEFEDYRADRMGRWGRAVAGRCSASTVGGRRWG